MLEERPSGRWRAKTKSGEARLEEHGWAGLSDLYEPYLLLQEMSGNYSEGMTKAMLSTVPLHTRAQKMNERLIFDEELDMSLEGIPSES